KNGEEFNVVQEQDVEWIQHNEWRIRGALYGEFRNTAQYEYLNDRRRTEIERRKNKEMKARRYQDPLKELEYPYTDITGLERDLLQGGDAGLDVWPDESDKESQRNHQEETDDHNE